MLKLSRDLFVKRGSANIKKQEIALSVLIVWFTAIACLSLVKAIGITRHLEDSSGNCSEDSFKEFL